MKVLDFSVRTIVEYSLRSGDLDASLSSWQRMQEGTRVHQLLQKEYSKEYKKEFPVIYKCILKDKILNIQGRMDLFNDGEIPTIIEIKTIHDFEIEPQEVHFAQAIMYAYLHNKANPFVKEYEIKLLYYNAITGERQFFVRFLNQLDLSEYCIPLINKFNEYLTTREEYKNTAKKSALNLDFPFPTQRKNQRDFMKGVYKTISDKKRLFCKAPTGTGKTISTLYPGIKAFSNNENIDRILYLTAKTVGRITAQDAMKKVSEKGFDGKVLTITGKEKMCPKDKVDCRPNICNLAKGFYDKVNKVREEILKNHYSIDREILVKYGIEYEMCPFELGLELFFDSHVVICDYNYVFDPRIAIRRNDSQAAKRTILLIDEAHNLVDRVRDMYSAQLDLSNINRVYKHLPKKNTVSKDFSKVKRMITELINTEEENTVHSLYPPKLIETLFKSSNSLRDYIANLQIHDKLLLDMYFDMLSFIRIERFFDETFLLYSNKNKYLKEMVIDTSKLISSITSDYLSTIFFSATLSPMDYYMTLFGSSENDYKLSIPSPFDWKNLDVKRIRKSTLYSDRQNTAQVLLISIKEFIYNKKGNYLVFFPSYEYLNMVFNFLNQNDENVDFIKSESNFNESMKMEFLNRFSAENQKTLVAFTVLGGVFSEGIDLIGDRLNGVFIVGVGLPTISFEKDLIKTFFDNEGLDGFYLSYVVPGINKVLQAGGRLIRSEEDKGTLILFDSRYFTSRYYDLLPYEWKKSIEG